MSDRHPIPPSQAEYLLLMALSQILEERSGAVYDLISTGMDPVDSEVLAHVAGRLANEFGERAEGLLVVYDAYEKMMAGRN